MRPKTENRRPKTPTGFTVIEVMMVVALMGVIVLIAGPFMSDELGRRDAATFAVEASDAVREAQSSVMSGRNDAKWGVHFEAAQFVFFQGATYSPADPANVVHQLSGFARVASVALTPGGACTVATGTGNCDIVFSNRFGTPSPYGTVSFSDGTATKTLTVNRQGMIDVN